MVSKAREDLPEPDRPVKTISLSRGRSSETSRRLCSRAPRTTRRSAIRGGYREGVSRWTGSAGAAGPAGASGATASTGYGGAQLGDLVTEEGRLLETEVGGGGFHLGFE